MSSAAAVGRKAQCHPRRRQRIAPAAISSTISGGEKPPSAKKGNAPICTASATMATSQASRCSGDLASLRKSKVNIRPRFDKDTTATASVNIFAIEELPELSELRRYRFGENLMRLRRSLYKSLI